MLSICYVPFENKNNTYKKLNGVMFYQLFSFIRRANVMNLSSLVLTAVGIFFSFVGVMIAASYVVYRLKGKPKSRKVRYY